MLPFAIMLGIAALSRGPGLRNPLQTVAITSCAPFRSNPKLHILPQNNPNVQESALLPLSRVPWDKRAMPAARGVLRRSSSRLSSSILSRRGGSAPFLRPCRLWQSGRGPTLEPAQGPRPCQATASGPLPPAGAERKRPGHRSRLCKQPGGEEATRGSENTSRVDRGWVRMRRVRGEATGPGGAGRSPSSPGAARGRCAPRAARRRARGALRLCRPRGEAGLAGGVSMVTPHPEVLGGGGGLMNGEER